MTSSPSSSTRDSFRHVVLTRFSVRFTNDQPPLPEDWLRYRLAFFEQAAVASMRSQTTKPDRWLVFCDASAPEWLRDELEELSEHTFDLVWLDEPWGHRPLKQAVAKVADRPYLITTRFDSDDALGVDFVRLVQSQFEAQDQMYVNLLRGLQLDRSLQVFGFDYPVNPFISLIERLDGEPRTVFQTFQHGRSRALAPVRNVVSDPAWLQIVHGGNVANKIQGPRVSPAVVRHAVQMDLDYDADAHGVRLFGQYVVSWIKLVAQWVRQPSLAKLYFEALGLRLRGTTTLDRRAG